MIAWHPPILLKGCFTIFPDGEFSTNFQTTVFNVLNWLHNADYSQFVSPNEQILLFGDSPEQWSEPSAHKLTNALISLWNDWGK